MSGLEKIVKEIEDEARKEAEAVVAKAEAEAKEIVAAAEKSAAEAAARIKSSTQQNVADVEQSRDSGMELLCRKMTLETKQKLLAETLDKAKNELYALPQDKYFALLALLAAHSAEAGKGEMLLNEKDKARMPAGFAAKVQAALPAGRQLEVSANTRPIDGGFVLKYGDVEENCSFSAMFDARKEEFGDKIRDILFA